MQKLHYVELCFGTHHVCLQIMYSRQGSARPFNVTCSKWMWDDRGELAITITPCTFTYPLDSFTNHARCDALRQSLLSAFGLHEDRVNKVQGVQPDSLDCSVANRKALGKSNHHCILVAKRELHTLDWQRDSNRWFLNDKSTYSQIKMFGAHCPLGPFWCILLHTLNDTKVPLAHLPYAGGFRPPSSIPTWVLASVKIQSVNIRGHVSLPRQVRDMWQQ